VVIENDVDGIVPNCATRKTDGVVDVRHRLAHAALRLARTTHTSRYWVQMQAVTLQGLSG